jgi:hypothetical protein
VPRSVNFAHPAFAELGENAVRPEILTHVHRSTCGEIVPGQTIQSVTVGWAR